MRVRFHLNGVEHEGLANELSTQGTFVACNPKKLSTGRLSLVIETDGNSVAVAGEVVKIDGDGFAMIFEPLRPATTSRLKQLINSDPDISPSEELPTLATETQHQLLFIKGKDWAPPVTDPTLHEWEPTTQPALWDESNLQVSSHESPSTINIDQQMNKKASRETLSESTAEKTEPGNEKVDLHQFLIADIKPTATDTSDALSEDAMPETTQTQEVNQDKQPAIQVTFENITSLIKEFTHNMSFGGLFTYSLQPFEQDQTISVILVHPVNGNHLKLDAKVVHSGSASSSNPKTGAKRYGIGLEFDMPLETLKKTLSEFITSHQPEEPTEEMQQIIEQARQILSGSPKTAHQLLGIDSDVSQEEVRSVYFKLMDRFHPDRFYGKISNTDRKLLEDLFRSLTKAYEDLMR